MDVGDFVTLPRLLDAAFLSELLGEPFAGAYAFDGIGDVRSSHRNGFLSFLADPRFADEVNENPRIAGVFCTAASVAGLKGGIHAVVVDDPKYSFFTLMDRMARRFHHPFQTRMGSDCSIAPSAVIAPSSVVIGDGVTIEAGAFVAPGSVLGDGVIVRANATVGVDGFQHQHTSRGMVSPLHDGWLFVERNAEIGYGASISRGFSYRPTRIGEGSKFDALSYVAHGASIGANTICGTHVCVMGHATVGDDVWLGPGAVVANRLAIGDKARISLGSVVTTDIPAGGRYSGNFAIPHDRFMARLKGS